MSSHNWIHDDGSLFTAAAPLSRDARRMLAAMDAVCGSPSGWYGHKYANEIPCAACEAAHASTPGKPTVIRDICSTVTGWKAHRYRSELACDPCDKAKLAYDESRCGSLAAWMRHRRRGEPPCDRCAEEVRRYATVRRARSRALGRPAPDRLEHARARCGVCGREVAWHHPGSLYVAAHKHARAGEGRCSGSRHPQGAPLGPVVPAALP